MGKAIVINDVDFSLNNIGAVVISGANVIYITPSVVEKTVFFSLNKPADEDIEICLERASDFSTLFCSIEEGQSTGSVVLDASLQGTYNLSVDYLGNTDYIFTKSSIEVTILHDLVIVGDRTPIGCENIGRYSILDKIDYKVLVPSATAVDSNYVKYVGNIDVTVSCDAPNLFSLNWNSNEECYVLTAQMGYYENRSESCTLSFDIHTTNGITHLTKVISASFVKPDYLVSSFSDLQAIETAVNNSTESSINLTKVGSSSTPSDGSGFSGIVFVLTGNINCNQSHVEIGKYNTSKSVDKRFRGVIDGNFYSLSNIGGNVGVAGSAASGGYVGSYLIGNGYSATVRNLQLSGSVVNVASRGYGGMFGFYRGTCNIQNVRTAVAMTTSSTSITAGSCGVAGWTTASSDTIIVKDSLIEGSVDANFSVSGLANGANSTVQRTIFNALLTVNQGLRANANCTVISNPSSSGTVEDCYATSQCYMPQIGNLTNGNYNLNCLSAINRVYMNTTCTGYPAGIYDKYGGSSSDYYVSDSLFYNSIFYINYESLAQNLFNNDVWIQSNIRYPMIDNGWCIQQLNLINLKTVS